MSSAIMKEKSRKEGEARGNMKKKCARLIFMEGEKSEGIFNRTGDF